MTESNKNPIKKRMILFLEEIGSNANQFADKFIELGKLKRNTRNYLHSNSGIQSDMLAIIATEYPQLNMNWLLTGEGSKFKNISENSENLSKQSKNDDRKNSIDEQIDKMIKNAIMNEIPGIIKAVGEAMRGQLAEQNVALDKYLENQKESSKMQMELFRDVVRILAKADPEEAKELDNKLRKLTRKIG